MKILAVIKQVFDTEAKIELKDGAIVSGGVKKILNPYDEYAVEEAVQLKEKYGGDVVAVAIGAPEIDGTLRHVLAMGCDDAILINDPALETADAAARAKALAAAIKPLEYDLILCGYQMIDCGDGEVPARLAELLGLGEIMAVDELTIDGTSVTAKSEQESGSLVVTGTLPLLIGVDKGLNEPRYPGMKSIMQARKKLKNIQKKSLADLGLSAADIAPVVKLQSVELPPKKAAGKLLKTPAELAELLHTEAKVV